ncbi:MAG: hypothetical protein E7549_01050 [Ruminococcaceae bacterium]|nr:hypothetical protein [Oscillospiraceae bacterium]
MRAKRYCLLAILMVCTTLLFSSCKERTDIADYQYMYDGIVEDWNKLTTADMKETSLLGFGEYRYNSELILFPRETPSTLKEFYFHWTPGIDVDGYAIYFTCSLSEEKYADFSQGIQEFTIQNGNTTTALLYDDTHFALPTYILQWSEVGEKWEVLEYIMLDENNHTAVFVYTMRELGYIESHSDYCVTPSQMTFLDENFSIYDGFENSVFDLSFLESLN